MNEQQFRVAAQGFLSWAGKLDCDAEGHLTPATQGAMAILPVDLAIPRSSKVPVAVNQVVPFHRLTRVYSWRAAGMATGSFAETRVQLATLSHDILSASNDAEALAACESILRWGGDRNSAVGALPFLRAQPGVLAYLNAVKDNLALRTAVVPALGGFPAVIAMNSMLTKVHAFNSGDGLPIYDSRVAGAIATLIEAWRRQDGRAEEPLLVALSFPEVGGGGRRRSVHARYPDSVKPPTLYYATGSQSTERATRIAREWASAKVRLGWLLSELLVEPTPAGIRSLEACLFMAGYDCSRINAGGV